MTKSHYMIFFIYVLRLFDCHSYLQGENQSQEEKPSFQNADLRADNQLTVSQLLLTRLKNEPRTTKSYKHDYCDTDYLPLSDNSLSEMKSRKIKSHRTKIAIKISTKKKRQKFENVQT